MILKKFLALALITLCIAHPSLWSMEKAPRKKELIEIYKYVLITTIKKINDVDIALYFATEALNTKKIFAIADERRKQYKLFCYFYLKINPLEKDMMLFSTNPCDVPGFFIFTPENCRVFNHIVYEPEFKKFLTNSSGISVKKNKDGTHTYFHSESQQGICILDGLFTTINFSDLDDILQKRESAHQ